MKLLNLFYYTPTYTKLKDNYEVSPYAIINPYHDKRD